MANQVITVVVRRALFFAAIWLVLTGAEPSALAVGAVAVPAVLWSSLRLTARGTPLRLSALLPHLWRFLRGALIGGIDVAGRALAPRMRLRPSWIAVPVTLTGGPRAALGAELSLMPGTLAAGAQGDALLIHVIDGQAGYETAVPDMARSMAALTGSARDAAP